MVPSPGEGAGGLKGLPILQKHVIHQFYDFHYWDLNSDLHFHFRVPLIPARAPPGGGARRGIPPNKHVIH